MLSRARFELQSIESFNESILQRHEIRVAEVDCVESA
jgi:hypothetical protein